MNRRYPDAIGQCHEACLDLVLHPVPKQTLFNVLQIICRKSITYKNDLPMNKRVLISENQVKYVEGIIVKRDIKNLRISKN